MDKRQNDVVKKVKVFLKKVGLAVDRVFLFGSYAKGDYRDGSDIDLLIVSDDFEGKKLFERGASLYNIWYGKEDVEVDFICLTSKEFERKKVRNGIVKYAVEEGVEIR